MKDGITWAGSDQLEPHPANPRDIKDDDPELLELAESIRVHGMLEPLVVVEIAPGRYRIVAGHRRWRANRLLGDGAVKMPCVVRRLSEVEQLEVMTIENAQRENLNPIEEARQFDAFKVFGYSVRDISRKTGINEARIRNRLILLELDDDIQGLIARRRFSSDTRVARALLDVPDDTMRVGLAQKLAGRGATIKAILRACDSLKKQLKDRDAIRKGESPALVLVGQRRPLPPAHTTVKLDVLRDAAKAMCDSCEVTTCDLRLVPEPAWTLIERTVRESCARCSTRGVMAVCRECPSVAFLERIAEVCEACPGVEMLEELVGAGAADGDGQNGSRR